MGNKKRVLSTVMLITLASKCLGFLRDVVLAYYFGAGTATDAYFVAQTIPEFLFSLVVQAIAIGFIPIYAEILHNEGRERADHFTNSLYWFGFLAVGLLILLVYGFTEPIVKIFASGFDEQTSQMAKEFVRIAVWGMFFRIISAIDSAYLNANDEFTVPALTGIPLDIITIVSIYVAFKLKMPVILAVSIALSFVGQTALQHPFVLKKKAKLSLRDFTPKSPYIKRIIELFLPVAFGVGANQINILVDRTLASSIEGGISALNYANKVDNILENIIILSLATVMFPAFSRYAAQKRIDKLSDSISETLVGVSFVMIPCAVFAFQYSEDVIELLFGHGAFNVEAIALTSDAMRCYSLGLVFISYNAILTRALYSIKKVSVASFCTCVSLLVNVCMNCLLAPKMGIRGLALATSMANMVLTILLSGTLAKTIGKSFLEKGASDIMKCLICSGLMGLVSWIAFDQLSKLMPTLLGCIISAIVGMIVYLFLALLLRVGIISGTITQKLKKLINHTK